MTRVVMLIVSHKTRDITLACIESVLAETMRLHEVVVVENASWKLAGRSFKQWKYGLFAIWDTTGWHWSDR